MAERRMFAKTIIDSDAFLEMPMSAQALYFHLSMRADDDGFLNNPKRIQRMVGASEDDLKLLLAKSFLISFESGVVVIKHWKIHNYIQADRYKPTVYTEEKALLTTKANKAYTLDTECIQDGYSLETQVRLGKDSIDKDSIGEDREVKESKGNKAVYYPDNAPLNDAFKEFVSMRNKIKKPLTANAIKRAMSKLDSLAGTDDDLAIKIIEQSVDHCWQTFYPLKENEPQGKVQTAQDYMDMWANV